MHRRWLCGRRERTVLIHAEDRGEGLSLAPGGIVLGIGAAAILAGAISGGLALGVVSEVDAACRAGASMTECPASFDQQGALSRFGALRDAGWALGIGGAAFAITGVVLMIVGATDDPATPAVACTGEGCVAAVRGTF